MKMGWLLGWAVPPAWFRRKVLEVFPKDEHCFVAAGPGALAGLEAAQPFDWVVGYSLGAHLLLMEVDRSQRLGRVALLAPIFAFAREEGAGGRVERAQLQYLKRWLRRAPVAALADFYDRAKLDVTAEDYPCAAQESELLWGLERLEGGRCPAVLPAGWKAWCGGDDALLDAGQLGALVQGLRVVKNASHAPAELLRAFAEDAP